MTPPVTTKVQTTDPTTTSSSSTFHSTFVPTGLATAGYVVLLTFSYPTTSRTISSVAATGMTWTNIVPKYIPTGVAGAFAMYMGLTTSTGSKTVTVTLNGTPGSGTSLAMFYDEFKTNLASPSWSIRTGGQNSSSSTTVDALCAAGLAAKYGDFFYAPIINSAANLNSSFDPLPWITYDTTDFELYGDVPGDQTVPQTGFVMSAADEFTMPTAVLTPGVVPEPALWVPPGVNMNVA